MKNTKTNLAASVSAAIIAMVFCIPLAGCPSQSQVSQLITVVGNSVNALVLIEDPTNPTLAKQLQDAFDAASVAVNNWKPGSPSQDVVQTLNIVLADINLIPNIPAQDQALIILAITTINSIITLVQPSTTGVASANVSVSVMTPQEYKKQWNSLASNPKLRIK